MMGRLNHLKRDSNGAIVDVRGRGLLWGVELATEAAPVVARCRELGMIVNVAGEKVVRLAPALFVEPTQIDEAVDILGRALAKA